MCDVIFLFLFILSSSLVATAHDCMAFVGCVVCVVVGVFVI